MRLREKRLQTPHLFTLRLLLQCQTTKLEELAASQASEGFTNVKILLSWPCFSSSALVSSWRLVSGSTRGILVGELWSSCVFDKLAVTLRCWRWYFLNRHCFSCRLVHGLDYKGNVCGDKKATPGSLEGLGVLYWVNPSQLFLAGEKATPFRVTNARGICVRDCPVAGNATTLRWVCDYPEGSMRNISMAQWAKRSYNYFDLLTPDHQASSKRLEGPCYPVLFPSSNGITATCNLARSV